MLKAQFRQLERGGVVSLSEGSSSSEAIVVQVFNLTLGKNDKLSCFVSDGYHSIKAFLKDKDTLQPGKHDHAIIKITQHIVTPGGKKLGISEFELLCEYGTLIGNPQPLEENAVPNPEAAESIMLDPKQVKLEHTPLFENNNKPLTESSSNRSMKTEAKQEHKEIRKEMRVPDARPLNGSVKDYETIKGLFVGLKGWHLLCRISKMDYQEFKKKNTDKTVRMLTIELIDRSDVKINGFFFYQAADKFREELKLNSVYKISEGSIANQSYNNSKNDKISPFKLMFSTNSKFEEVSDVHIIAKSEDSAIPLHQVLSKAVFDQEYDILGILVEIEEPKEINKGDKQLVRWNWMVADPISQQRIHAVLWNDKVKPDHSLVGKTILLSSFTLHNYNGSLTLNSKARSSIQAANYQAYRDLEDEVMRNYQNYHLVSQMRARQDNQGSGEVFTDLKSLSAAIEAMQCGQTLRSDLCIHINRLMMKKWYYEGCPSCNKSAEKGSSCHCGKYVQQTVPHFILPLEMADPSGSLFSTAYDEQAKKVFWEEEGVIFKLMGFDEKQLKDVVEDYYFQEFKVRVYTKKDLEGRIKHNMGKLQKIVPEQQANDNVARIRQLMGRAQ